MTVTSPAFDQGTIPREYTCRGAGVSPPIYWSGAPQRTRSLALVMDDSAAPITPYVYWVVFNISPAADIQAGRIPQGASVAENSKGVAGYTPPCPAAPHEYRFTVYALNTILRLPEPVTLKQAWTAIAAHAIARGRLTATARP
jgi:Raf kinase inhibitor-like YbhB/YbcL family protein